MSVPLDQAEAAAVSVPLDQAEAAAVSVRYTCPTFLWPPEAEAAAVSVPLNQSHVPLTARGRGGRRVCPAGPGRGGRRVCPAGPGRGGRRVCRAVPVFRTASASPGQYRHGEVT